MTTMSVRSELSDFQSRFIDRMWPERSFVGRLPSTVRQELAAAATRRTYSSGETLFHEQDHADAIRVIVDGIVALRAYKSNGREVLISLRRAGDLLGETTVIGEARHPWFATAFGTVTAAVIPTARYRGLLAVYPELASATIRELGDRLTQVTRYRVELSVGDVLARLAYLLLDLAREGDERYDLGEINMTQHDLALLAGTSTAATEKALRQMRSQGLIATGYRKIVITDRVGLLRKVSWETN